MLPRLQHGRLPLSILDTVSHFFLDEFAMLAARVPETLETESCPPGNMFLVRRSTMIPGTEVRLKLLSRHVYISGAWRCNGRDLLLSTTARWRRLMETRLGQAGRIGSMPLD